MTADMISRADVLRPTRRVSSRLAAVPVVPLVAMSAFLVRLPFLGAPASPDEAGFLVVASQWHVGGTSLYGNYWVDRPPLLIAIFQLAHFGGGMIALRVIGALATAATIALLASTAQRVFGQRAAGWTAVVAAALLVTPMFGSGAVNGELLATPFIALGIRLAVEVVETDDAVSARGAALGTGVAAVLALLVKQNMADVAVFAVVCWVVAWRTRRLTGRSLVDLLALAATGAVVGYAVVMLYAMAHGTSPLGVYEATYPFRLQAGHVLAAIPGDSADIRLSRLALSALLSGAPVVLLAFVARSFRRHGHAPVVWAIVAVGSYATASILAGGSYWLHYLVQTVPVVALAAGAVAAWTPRFVTWALVSLVVASSVVSLVGSVASPPPAPGNIVGRTLGASAQRGDTMLSAFGDADIPMVSGLSSPYPYLWSLPSRTLDPEMTLLRGILAGPSAPTWIVVRGSSTMNRLATHGAAAMIDRRYEVVGKVCGRTIYLLRGLQRTPLRPSDSCSGTAIP